MTLSKKNLFAIGGVIVALLIVGGFFLFWRSSTALDTTFSLETASLSGQVAIPDGVSADDLQVQTIMGDAAVSADGAFATSGVNTRQLLFVNDADGNSRYMGFVSPEASEEINAQSTATILLFFALGGVYLPGESWEEAFSQIEAFVSGSELEDTVESLSSTDPTYLTDDNEILATALTSAADAFLSSNRQSFLDWLIPSAHAEPDFALDTQAKSGVRIDPGFYNEVTFVNQYRRPVRMMMYEIGYEKDGEKVEYDPPKLEQYIDLPSVTKLSDLASTVVELIVGKVHYGERASDVIKLIPDVSSADVTFYRVYGLGWGAKEVNYSAGGDLLDELLKHSEEIQLMTGIQEVLLPVFTWVVSFKDIETAFGYGGQTLVKELLKWFTGSDGARAVLPPLQKGDLLGASRAMFEFLAKSPSLRDEISNFFVSGIAKDNPAINVTEYVDRSAKIFAAPLKTVDLVMKYFDGAVLTANYLAASRGEQWTIAVRPPSVSLEPPSAELQAPTNGFFKIVVQDATDSMKFETQWSHENQDLGHFVGPATDPHQYTSEFPVGVYQTEDDVEGGDTISAKVFLIEPDGNRKELGTATAAVTVKKEEHCGKGTIELPPEYKLTYVLLDAIDKPIFFNAAGSNVHEALEVVPPRGVDFSLVTWASYTPDVEFYRDIVDHGTDYDFRTEPKECDPVNTWDCLTVIPITVQRYLVTVPKTFTLDPHIFTQHYLADGSTDGRGIGDLSPIYENNGDGTPTISYTCKVGRWDGSTQY
ncbi:hypothetical protein HZA87_05455 [Candidatus Uhrbacteria bacterium]|nr:hypothetical protein [Candidatus Uhrbacteria bacterium]